MDVKYGLSYEELAGGWKGLRNEDFRDMYTTPNIIWMIRSWIMRYGQVDRTGDMGNAYSIFVGKPERNSTWKT
jgi:hypothetical protein